jgi:hypothetical protein
LGGSLVAGLFVHLVSVLGVVIADLSAGRWARLAAGQIDRFCRQNAVERISKRKFFGKPPPVRNRV